MKVNIIPLKHRWKLIRSKIIFGTFLVYFKKERPKPNLNEINFLRLLCYLFKEKIS